MSSINTHLFVCIAPLTEYLHVAATRGGSCEQCVNFRRAEYK